MLVGSEADVQLVLIVFQYPPYRSKERVKERERYKRDKLLRKRMSMHEEGEDEIYVGKEGEDDTWWQR